MCFFKKKKKEGSAAFRREMAERFCGQHVKYITENIDGVDEVIGRSGSLNMKDGVFIVSTPETTIFRCPAEEMEAWELLSKDGVVLTGDDIEHGGERRTIIVHFVYYRK